MLISEEYRNLERQYIEILKCLREVRHKDAACELESQKVVEVRTTTGRSYTVRGVKAYYVDSEHKHVFMDEQKQVIAIISNVADMFFSSPRKEKV